MRDIDCVSGIVRSTSFQAWPFFIPRSIKRGLIEARVMLNPEPFDKRYPKMTADQRRDFEQAVAEENAVRAENVAAAKPVAEKLLSERKKIADLVAELRAAREVAGVSLSEMEKRTGICKSALSRLENSKAPNPTLATLQRYAAAIGVKLVHQVKPNATRQSQYRSMKP